MWKALAALAIYGVSYALAGAIASLAVGPPLVVAPGSARLRAFALAGAAGGIGGGAIDLLVAHFIPAGTSLLADGFRLALAVGVGAAIAAGIIGAVLGERGIGRAHHGGRALVPAAFGLGGVVGGFVGGVLSHLIR